VVDLALLRHTALFASLNDTELRAVAEICREQHYTTGSVIFREGDPGEHLFLIVEGGVRITRTIPGPVEESLAMLRPGACFGEMSVLDRSERSTDATAHGASVLATIARADFERMLASNHDLAYKILWSVVRLISTRLRATNDNLRSVLATSMF
jgi:CRP-like cAMP-binding protein